MNASVNLVLKPEIWNLHLAYLAYTDSYKYSNKRRLIKAKFIYPFLGRISIQFFSNESKYNKPIF
jgi:hypothetical protein